jgi:cytochrome P450
MSALLTFVLTMTRYPSAQAKAQEELDRVVGRDRLPDFNDSPNLPYLNALVREVLRWHPVGPVGS